MPLRREVPRESPPTIKVRAKNETIAKWIKHPNRAGFTKEGIGFWPNDTFTQKRLRDGDISLVVEETKEEAPKHRATTTHREAKPA